MNALELLLKVMDNDPPHAPVRKKDLLAAARLVQDGKAVLEAPAAPASPAPAAEAPTK
jgi:hypothetical protein